MRGAEDQDLGKGDGGRGRRHSKFEYVLGIKCPVLRSDAEPLF